MAVAMLATTSCKDDFAESFVGEEATVEFSISTPEIGTRAYSDGTTATVLQYAVYEANDAETPTEVTGELTNFDGNETISLTLKTGKDYKVVFWAAAPDAPYEVDFAEKTMTVNYTGAKSNDESRDAFYAVATVNTSATQPHSVELKRPFAQLNIGTNDYAEAAAANYEPKYSKVVVKQLKNQLNLLTGAVEGTAADITFGYSVIPNKQDDYVEANKENFPVTGYEYLAMNYLLVPADQEVVDVTFYHNTDGTSDIAENTKTVGSVPLKRNYRTNIYGKLLTGNADIEVEIVPDFGGEYNNPIAVSTIDELNEAIANPTGDIVLQNDINLENTTIKIGASTRSNTISNIVINLNGKTVTSTAKKAFEVYTNATFKNGVIKAANRCIDTRTAVNLVLNDVTLIADKYTSSYGNPQPLTIGGTDNGTEVTMNNVEISAEAGYGIITFVETNLTATNSNISGYSALYVKPGSDNSEFNFKNTELSGSTANNDVEGNSFSTIAPRANNVTINVDGDSKVIATGNYCYALSLGSKFENEKEIFGAKVTILGTIEGNILASGNLNDNIITVDKQYKEALEAKGYTVEIVNGNAVIINAVYVTNASELQKAVTEAKGGETIKLTNNIKFGEKFYDNGGWKDGLGYRGDKSFTIDLNGYTIDQDGKLNDYLLWIKNEGSKANTITIKNGTLDAGTTAYCALCTASSHDNKLTINLEDVTLINNISNGSTVKVRAGSVLNVNAGTKIIGKNSYLGIENWNAEVNVYDGAEIYMNGTSSYNGCLIGVGGNGTINVYGGYGKGVSGGLIAMTSGGTINVSGGEWIANTDGTYANSNKSVLIAQSDKQYNAGAGNAVVNVTGGTFKGGYNCYGNAVGDAQINISGGNFNANPTSYLEEDKTATEANGTWTVK